MRIAELYALISSITKFIFSLDHILAAKVKRTKRGGRKKDRHMTAASLYKEITGEKILLIFSWIIMVWALLIISIGYGIITGLFFSSVIVVGVVMRHFTNKRVKQLKERA